MNNKTASRTGEGLYKVFIYVVLFSFALSAMVNFATKRDVLEM